jgi:hypothetical protein
MSQWERSVTLLEQPQMKDYVDSLGGESLMRLRQYRIWLQRLMSARYPDLCDRRLRCNFWLIFHILMCVEQPFRDKAIRELWKFVMIRALLTSNSIDCSDKNPHELADFIHDSIPEIPLDRALVYAHVYLLHPGILAAEMSDGALFSAMGSVPLAALEDFALHTYQGPRANRLSIQKLPIDPTTILQYPPPRPGYDLTLHIAMTATTLPESMPLPMKLHVAFQINPGHLRFV